MGQQEVERRGRQLYSLASLRLFEGVDNFALEVCRVREDDADFDGETTQVGRRPCQLRKC